MYTLGIETSCDETSCAVLKDCRVLSNVTVSSLREHRKYGGVIPEIATRAHLTAIDKVMTLALEKAGVKLKKISLIAATHKPGLIGALVVGLNFAKALALGLKIPFLGVNHLHAHVFAPFLNNRERLQFPMLGVVVSGGHTELYAVRDFDRIKLLGQTRDDAAGEVFDKVAHAYGLGYPGGPMIDKLYEPGYKNEFKFKCGRDGFNLSFSGIKTALMYKKMEVEKSGPLTARMRVKILSSFQESVVQTLVSTIVDAARRFKFRRVALGGGVIANRRLRAELAGKETADLRFLVPPIEFAADNAAAVAGLGFYLYNNKGKTSSLSLPAGAN